jgi:hypothetical protein
LVTRGLDLPRPAEDEVSHQAYEQQQQHHQKVQQQEQGWDDEEPQDEPGHRHTSDEGDDRTEITEIPKVGKVEEIKEVAIPVAVLALACFGSA